MRDLVHDVRYAWRQLRRTPGFTVVAVLTLGLGIAVSTTFFTVVNALLFKPLPVARAEGVHTVTLRHAERRTPVALPLAVFRTLERELPDPISAAAALSGLVPATVQIPGRLERLTVEAVTGGYPRVLDIPIQRGRWLTTEDEVASGEETSAVISDLMWRDWFAGDPAALGRTVRVNGRIARIVGVAPPRYRGVFTMLNGADLWVPLAHWPAISPEGERMLQAGGYELLIRPRSGASLDEAGDAIAARHLSEQPPDRTEPVTPVLRPLADRLRVRQLGMIGNVLLTIAGLILLAACANLANMLYARGAARAGETAVRLSLGASTGHIVRLGVAEALVISMLAASLGLALAVAGSSGIGAVLPALEFNRYLRITLDLSPDGRVLLMAFGTGLTAALVVGLLTSWRASRILPASALAPSGVSETATRRSGERLRPVLVSLQVTAALLLVMATGLFWEQLRKEQREDEVLDYRIHFDAERIVTGTIDASMHGYHEVSGRDFYRRALDAVRAVEGVDRAAVADAIPGGRAPSPRLTIFEPEIGEPLAGAPRRVQGRYVSATPGFLALLGLDVQRGRDVAPSDVAGAPAVAVVSRSFADAMWPDRDPIGQRMRFTGAGAVPITVVGVSADPVESADESATRPSQYVFLPFDQHYRPRAMIAAWSERPMAVYGPIRAAVRALDADVAVSEIGTVADTSMAWLRPIRIVTTLMTLVGLLALGMAMLGVYGVVAFFVSQRTREFGIRLALGATPGRVRRMVFDHTVHLMLVGLLPGVWIAASGSRWLQSNRTQLMPNEIATWVVVPLLVLAAGIVAGAVPAWRASRVDPNVALRTG